MTKDQDAGDFPIRAGAGDPRSEAEARARREAATRDLMVRTGLDETVLETLVHTFYGRIRQDDLLAPVFEARIKDWPWHLERMCRFWSSVALLTGSYAGRPMPAHAPLPVDARHFDRWLALFEETARDVCTPAGAEHVIERAHRIAQSLELGVAIFRGNMLSPGERLAPLDPLAM